MKSLKAKISCEPDEESDLMLSLKRRHLLCLASSVNRCWNLWEQRFYEENPNWSMGIFHSNEATAVTAFQSHRCDQTFAFLMAEFGEIPVQ